MNHMRKMFLWSMFEDVFPKVTFMPDTIRIMQKFSETCLRRYKTAILYLSFLSLGLSAAIPGPTLLDLQAIVQTDTSHIAYIYLGRSSGYLLGSFIGGVLLDCLKSKQLLLLLFNLVISVGVFGTPWCRDVYTLVSVMAISGAAMGALDTGGNVWCLDLWGENSSIYFQALHFLFGLGAFLSPLIAEPFLAQQEDYEQFFSNTSYFDDHSTNDTIFSSDNYAFTKSLPNITYAYSIIGVFAFFVTLLFAALFCISTKEETEKPKASPTSNKGSNFISVFVVLLASVLLSVYAGIEIGYGQMIATYAVKSDLRLSKATASLITSVYWGTFTFSRGLSIVLSAKLSPLSLILTDFVLMLLASVTLVLFGNTYIEFLWIGTAILGAALASFYPSTITWVEKHVDVSNKTASAFVIAASLGEMIVPLTISQFVDANPKILLYIVVYSVVICGILILFLWLILKKIGYKYTSDQEVSNYVEENESLELNVQTACQNESPT